MKTFFQIATERSTIATSAKVSLVVGTILALINYADRIFFRQNMQALDWIKVVITYGVPYCVATYGAARFGSRKSKAKTQG
jgi:hypothetical protein